MQKQIEPGYVSRNAYARAPCRFLHDKSVVIKAQSPSEVPVSATPLVLSINRWLDVQAVINKPKRRLRSAVKRSGIGDCILQELMYWAEDAVHARLPVMMPGVPGKVAAGAAFAMPGILRNNHRRRKQIRSQRGAGMAGAPG